jgi:hypothetical protein
MRYKILLGCTLLFGIAVIILAQFSIPTLFSADGYLHIRMAQFLKEWGPHYDFHWARYSVFARNFADKDFLYHVLLIPFTFFPNIFFGAKVSAALFTAALYLIFWWMLARHCRQKYLIPPFLIAFLCSAAFLQSLSQPRNMIIIIALTLLFTDALIKKNQWALFTITCVYALTHVSSPYLLLFALLGEGVRFANEREFSRESIVTVSLGLVAGCLMHPNFPNNLLIFYLNGILVPIFALKWGLELGAEFFPIDTRDFVLSYPFILIALLLLIALGATQTKKARTSTQIWLAITGFFFIFSFFSQRYLAHVYPLVLISLASYLSDWLAAREGLTALRQNKYLRAAGIIAGLLLFILLGLHTYKGFRQRLVSERIYNGHYEAVGALMSRHIPAGEVIFHANWSDSQYFIGLNPKDDYFVTLDPIYMYYWDKNLYNLYRETAFGRAADPYAALKNIFKVNYGYVGKNYFSGLIAQIRPDPRFEVMAEDGLGLIFRVK